MYKWRKWEREEREESVLVKNANINYGRNMESVTMFANVDTKCWLQLQSKIISASLRFGVTDYDANKWKCKETTQTQTHIYTIRGM